MFTLDQLTAAERQFYEFIKNCNELKVGNRMPTMAEQRYLMDMLQNKLYSICKELEINYYIKPFINYRFEVNSLNIGLAWECVK